MWIILFVILILSTLAGLAYLTSRVAKFDILIKIRYTIIVKLRKLILFYGFVAQWWSNRLLTERL